MRTSESASRVPSTPNLPDVDVAAPVEEDARLRRGGKRGLEEVEDTSLVFILGITDLLRIGRLIPEQQQEFYGKSIETLLVVALMFWVVSIILSQISRSIENRLNLSN